VAKADAGSRLVNQAGTTMREVVESIKRVTDIMGEISAASQEQTDGIGQIQLAISQMDQTTQQNAALVEEAAAASESLREQAAKLSQTVAVFRLDGSQVRVARAAPPKTHVAPLKKKPAAAASAPAEPLRVKRLASAGRGDEWEEF
jgi:methyl-accepting chemotaxis protein